MTRFKKCDYCKGTDKRIIKLKDVGKLFQPRGNTYDGKGIKHQGRPVIIFLCRMCYDMMFPGDPDPMKPSNYITEHFAENPPEFIQLYNEKRGFLKGYGK